VLKLDWVHQIQINQMSTGIKILTALILTPIALYTTASMVSEYSSAISDKLRSQDPVTQSSPIQESVITPAPEPVSEPIVVDLVEPESEVVKQSPISSDTQAPEPFISQETQHAIDRVNQQIESDRLAHEQRMTKIEAESEEYSRKHDELRAAAKQEFESKMSQINSNPWAQED
jgi:hypothetical protein